MYLIIIIIIIIIRKRNQSLILIILILIYNKKDSIKKLVEKDFLGVCWPNSIILFYVRTDAS